MCSRTRENGKNKVGPVIWDTLYIIIHTGFQNTQNRMAFSVGKEELSEPVPLLKKLSAEFLGTMLLVIFGCGAAAGQGNENSKTMVTMK